MNFSGTVAEIYDRHLSRAIFDPFAKRLVRGLPECQSALEIACGTGVCTRRLANILPEDAVVIASDASESMVSIAARKLLTSSSVQWVRAKAESLPFRDDTFDLAVCGFGVMFFDDRLAAFEEVFRVVLPGGLFRYTVWASESQNQWIEVVRAAVSAFFPDVEATWYEAPFQFFELDANIKLLAAAGFPDVRVNPIKLSLRSVDPVSLARGFIQGNPAVRALTAQREIPFHELENAVASGFVKAFGSPIEANMKAFIFEAGVIK
jgi:ubiquinone/menaquinone biosynthesis C-methylase UbiE